MNDTRLRAALTCLVASLSLTACGAWMNWLAPPEQQALAKGYFADIQARHFAPVEANFAPQYRSAALPAGLAKVAGLFPAESPRSVKLVGATAIRFGDHTRTDMTFEYEFPHGWVVAEMVLDTKAGRTEIEGIHVVPQADSLEHANTFRLEGKTPLHYGMLALTIAIVAFTAATALVALFSRIPRRKWLWIIFVLLGFGQFSFNWTTGAVHYNVLSVLVFGASYAQQFYGPAILSFGFPLGAILFWERRRQWRGEPVDTERDLRDG